MPDSRTFSRTLSGVCLLLGPLLLALRAAVDPAWAVEPAAFRSEVAAAPDRFALSLAGEVGGSRKQFERVDVARPDD